MPTATERQRIRNKSTSYPKYSKKKISKLLKPKKTNKMMEMEEQNASRLKAKIFFLLKAYQ